MKLLRRASITVLILIPLGVGILLFFFPVDGIRTENLENLEQTLVIYDRDGQVAAGIWDSENRIRIPLEEIPLHVRQAFIAIEDTRFYTHRGIDPYRILGALAADMRAGSYVQGASTITQQTVKLTHLTPDKTIARKLSEIVLALRLERTMTKDEILETYLNLVYFGSGCYGIESAARTYFGKSASALTLAEGALLAGVVRGPSLYAPHIDPDRSRARRDTVLAAMLEAEYIDEAAYRSACAAPCTLSYTPPIRYTHSDYVDRVLEEAETILAIDREELLTRGYRIHTGMDARLQAICEEAREKEDLFPSPAADGTLPELGAVFLRAEDAAIAALIGGRNYAHGDYHRATQAMRSPGSAIKPILVYAPAIESGRYTPATPILDEACDFSGYAPRNASYQYHGWVSLQEAAANSYNIPAVKVLQDIGVETGKACAASAGIPFAADDNHLALALGGMTEGTTLLQLTGSYMPLAAGGLYADAACITRIEDSRGKILYRRSGNRRRILSAETACLVTSMLEEAVATGTAHRLSSIGIPLAAKTGTVSYQGKGVRDACIVAYNCELISGVWMGFDRTDSEHMLPRGTGGGSLPASFAEYVLSAYYADKAAPAFVRPATVTDAELDAVVYAGEQKCLLAGENIPEEERMRFLFRRTDIPTEISARCIPPAAPEQFRLWLNYAWQPSLSFEALRTDAVYTVRRRTERGTWQVCAVFPGTGGIITWTDRDASPGTLLYAVRASLPDGTEGPESIVRQVSVPLSPI